MLDACPALIRARGRAMAELRNRLLFANHIAAVQNVLKTRYRAHSAHNPGATKRLRTMMTQAFTIGQAGESSRKT